MIFVFVFVTLAIALTVPGFVFAVRALPWVDAQVKAAVKPWVCDICMSFWSTALFTSLAAALARDPWLLLCAGPVYTVAMIVLSFMERPIAPPAPPAPPATPEMPPVPEMPLADRLEP